MRNKDFVDKDVCTFNFKGFKLFPRECVQFWRCEVTSKVMLPFLGCKYGLCFEAKLLWRIPRICVTTYNAVGIFNRIFISDINVFLLMSHIFPYYSPPRT